MRPDGRSKDLAKALEAARARVELLERLQASASAQLTPDIDEKAEGEAAPLVTPEGLAILEAWIEEARASSPAGATIIPEIVRDRCVAEGDQAGLARLIGHAERHFEQATAKTKKRQDDEDRKRQEEARRQYELSHPLADARERLEKMAREKKKAVTDPGGPIREAPTRRGPRMGRGPR